MPTFTTIFLSLLLLMLLTQLWLGGRQIRYVQRHRRAVPDAFRLELPFNAWRAFVIESRFGFNRLTPGLFFADQAKHLLLLLLLGVPLAFAVLWIMQQTGEYWWLYAWLLWTG